MSEKHQEIVEELVEEYSSDSDVIGVVAIGSVGRGDVTPTSDIDLQVIYENGHYWKCPSKERRGVALDLVYTTKGFVKHQTYDYPYLGYLQLDSKILYDPTGFMENITEEIREYINSHPEVVEFWEKEEEKMREAKERDEKPRDFREVFDEAERKFSEEGKVTRDWFRSEE